MNEPHRPHRDVSEEAECMPMSEEELLDIERRVCDFEWHPKTERIIVALVAEVRRLRARMSDPESWPVGYCAVCDTAMRQSPNGQWWHEDTTHDHVAVHEDVNR